MLLKLCNYFFFSFLIEGNSESLNSPPFNHHCRCRQRKTLQFFFFSFLIEGNSESFDSPPFNHHCRCWQRKTLQLIFFSFLIEGNSESFNSPPFNHHCRCWQHKTLQLIFFYFSLKEIVRASTLPLSIIIVGVGKANFEAMEELDGDEVRVCYRGQKALRDIVQFVPFRDFQKKLMSGGQSVKLQLAREVLAEIPDQFLSYMSANNVVPGVEGGAASVPQSAQMISP